MSQLYCLLGLPGSGKGTIARAVAESSRRRISVVSTGDLARSLLDDRTAAAMADRALFPDEDRIREHIWKAVRRQFSGGAEAVILDGCPRFLDQLLWVESEFFDKDPVYVKINVASEQVLHDRIRNRARDSLDAGPAAAHRIARHSAYLAEMESYIMQSGLRYYSVMNDDVDAAVQQFRRVVPSPAA